MFKKWLFLLPAALGLVLQAIDEGAERAGPGRLELARQFQHAQHVLQRLLPRRPDGDAGVGASLLQEER